MSTGETHETCEVSAATSVEDVDRINQFFNSPEIKHDLHWFTYRDTLIRAFERDDRRLFYIESQHGDIIGALMVWCESRVLDEGEAQVRLVAVDPEYQGNGLGNHLCEYAETFAVRQSQTRMIADIVASSSAIDFWYSIGYKTVGQWETDGERSMVTVQKELQ